MNYPVPRAQGNSLIFQITAKSAALAWQQQLSIAVHKINALDDLIAQVIDKNIHSAQFMMTVKEEGAKITLDFMMPFIYEGAFRRETAKT